MICHVPGCGKPSGWWVTEDNICLLCCEDCAKNAEIQGYQPKAMRA